MRNFLFTGNPATGKTFLARAAAYYLCHEKLNIDTLSKWNIYKDLDKIEEFVNSDRCEFIQVHPNMTYEDIVYGIDIKAAGSVTVSYVEKRVKLLCDRAKISKDLFAIIFDDISRIDAGSLLGNLIYAIEFRGESVSLADGAELSVPSNVIVIFTECRNFHAGQLDYAVRRRMDYILKLKPDRNVLESYYEKTLNANDRRVITDIFDSIKDYINDYAAPDIIDAVEKYMPGHGMFMVEQAEIPYFVLDKFRQKLVYQIAPFLSNLESMGILHGEIGRYIETLVAMINTGVEGSNRIAKIRKILVNSGVAVIPYTLSDVAKYYSTEIVPHQCTDHKGIIESVIDAIILNGVVPYDISLPGLLLNLKIASVRSKIPPTKYASYLVKMDEAKQYYYETPAQKGWVKHAYYSSRAARNGRWRDLHDTVGYQVSYNDGSTPDSYLYLNGIRSHVFNADLIASENNAAELFGSTYRLISYYMRIYEYNISLFSGSDKGYKALKDLLGLEIKYLQALKADIRLCPGDKKKTRFYGKKLLQFRTLWNEKGTSVKVDGKKFDDLVSGNTPFSMDAYEDIYLLTSGSVKTIEIKGVVKMTDLKDYQQIMENIGVRQMIFQGPPGTSKTFESKKFVLKQLAPKCTILSKGFVSQEDISKALDQFKLTEADYADPSSSSKLQTGGWDLVQFHPSYGYEDFIRGIEVTAVEGMPYYNSVNRILGKIAEFAKIAEKSNPDKPPKFYLVIDEINRANIATVFGELIYGLEYRDSKVSTPYEVADRSNSATTKTKDIVLGKNLFIIGTMNTADKSIDSIDYAIRRRFLFIDSPADREVVISCYRNASGNNDENSIELLVFDAVQAIFDNESYFNNEYQKSDVRLGHTYFLRKRKDGYKDDFIERFVFQIIPILREYVKDGILDTIKDLKALEHSPSEVRDAADWTKRVCFISDNIMLYVKEFGNSNKSGQCIDNKYVGNFLNEVMEKIGY